MGCVLDLPLYGIPTMSDVPPGRRWMPYPGVHPSCIEARARWCEHLISPSTPIQDAEQLTRRIGGRRVTLTPTTESARIVKLRRLRDFDDQVEVRYDDTLQALQVGGKSVSIWHGIHSGLVGKYCCSKAFDLCDRVALVHRSRRTSRLPPTSG